MIRFSTLSAALFTEIDGFEFRRGQWTAVHVEELSPEQREQLVKYTGRILGVHPDDEETFASFAAPEEPEEPPAGPGARAARTPAHDLDTAAPSSSPSESPAAPTAVVTAESALSEPAKAKSKAKAKGEDREREQH